MDYYIYIIYIKYELYKKMKDYRVVYNTNLTNNKISAVTTIVISFIWFLHVTRHIIYFIYQS